MELLLTSGVITALIAALVSLAVSLINNKNLRRIERVKKKLELETQRLSKLIKLQEKLRLLGRNTSSEIINAFRNDGNELIKRFIDETSEAKDIYEQYKTYFDTELEGKIDIAISSVGNAQNKITEAMLEGKDISNTSLEIKQLISEFENFRTVLDSALTEQLSLIRKDLY